MKKSIRILSVVMALAMLLGTFSVLGSAYQGYKDQSITTFNDIDKPTFTTEQYASMACDELDRMLAEEQIYLTKDDIFVGELDLRSVNSTLASVGTLIDSADQLLEMLGSADQLKITDLRLHPENEKTDKTMLKRSTATDNTGNCTDLEIFLRLIAFLHTNTPVLASYVDGTFNLGALDSVITDFKFNIRNILMGLLEGIMDDDVEWDEYTPAAGRTLDVLLQDLVEYELIGVYDDNGSQLTLRKEPDGKGGEKTVQRGLIWDFLQDNNVPYATQKDIIANTINICNTNENAYNFIEKLMQDAFDYVAVPELNNVTRPWLRETAGIVYDKSKLSEPGYDGEPWTADTVDANLAAIFDLDGMHIPTYASWIAANPAKASKTFIANFNDFLGYAATLILNGTQYPTDQRDANGYFWDYSQGDAALFNNIGSLARYVLQNCGSLFFSDYIKALEPSQYAQMSNQQIYAFVIRVILNSSVDWMYIPDSCDTLADVCYEAVAQLAWQDIPQYTYTKPVKTGSDENYYKAIVDKALTILMDVAIYSLNQYNDMNPAARATGYNQANNAKNGLLPYQGDDGNWTVTALQVATWGVHNYGKMLTSENCTLDAIQLDPNNDGTVGNCTINDAWEDIDLIVNSIFPISSTLEGSSKTWLNSEISARTNSDGKTDVIRSILFDYIVYPVLNLDATNFEKLFTKNAQGTFALDTIKTVIIDLLKDVLNLIFPGALTGKFDTLDDILQNNILAGLVTNILEAFYVHAEEWAAIALPVVCDILELTASQEFKKMDCMMPANISVADANKNGVSFKVYNGCSGLNTSFVNENGAFKRDDLYKYEIDSLTCSVSGSATTGVSASGLSKGTILNGGDSATVDLAGTFTDGSVIEVTISYYVKDENGQYLADKTKLACTRYAYVGNVAEDDSDFKVNDTLDDLFTLKTSPSIYLNRGQGLGSAESYSLILSRAAKDNGNDVVASVTSVSGVNWLEINPDASKISANTTKGGGTFGFSPLKVKDGFTRASTSYSMVTIKDADAFAAAGTLYVQDAKRNYVAATSFDKDAVYYTMKTNADSTDTLIPDGTYNLTIGFSVNGVTRNIPVKIFLYDDFGLTSYYNNIVTANRQEGDFEDCTSEWNAYKTALQNAGNLVLAPKNYTTFDSNKNNNVASGYANKYAELYDALADAVEALDAKKANNTDVNALKAAIESYKGTSNSNYVEGEGWVNKEYYDSDYTFFGRRDFVPHTYIKFNDALGRANDLINKVTVYPPVEPEDPGDGASVYEYNNYLEAKEIYDLEYEAYLEKLENVPTLDPVDVAYALHMVNLTGSRLIALPGDTSKLQFVYDTYGQITSRSTLEGTYSDKTWSNYQNAVAFAADTLDADDPRPSQITTALSELVEAYKKLNEGCDYFALNEAIAAAEAINEADYTAESYAAFQEILNSARSLVADDLSKSAANQDRIDNKTNELTAALTEVLVPVGGGDDPSDASYPMATEDMGLFFSKTFMYTNTPILNEYVPDFMLNQLGMEADGKFVSGLGVYLSPDMIDGIFPSDQMSGCYGVWEANESGSYGTLSWIDIYSEATGEAIDKFYIFVFGDPTGDSEIDNVDSQWIEMNGEQLWWGESVEMTIMCLAGDVNLDSSTDSTDSMLIEDLCANNANDDQTGLNGGFQPVDPSFWESFG